MTAWFDNVKRRREEKYGTGGDGESGWDRSIQDPVSNSAARNLIVGG